MKLQDIREHLPKKFYSFLESKILELRPSQEKAINSGILNGNNIVVCTPTASGKTLVAELAAIKSILEGKGKTIYTVPLKALASEKFNDFKKYEELGVKVALSLGDLDSADPFLERYDLIICSNEKLDSLIRHNAPWLQDVSCFVIDEVHLLNDVGRGPTLEIIITMLRRLIKPQIIALSATIGNPEKLAEWLDAKLVQDTWRPVKLYEGISFDGEVDFFGEKKNLKISKKTADPTVNLVLETIDKGKQSLVFVNSKKATESVAEKIVHALVRQENMRKLKSKKQMEMQIHKTQNPMQTVPTIFNAENSKLMAQESSTSENSDIGSNKVSDLGKISSDVAKALSSKTQQCERLATCCLNGIAFHHAGLAPQQRELIENAFKQGTIKIIVCTPTLALGLEFPTDRTIIRDLKRFTGYSQQWIPVLEMKQFVGRAGRPSYHDEGEAICIASSEKEKQEILKRYIQGQPEEIFSKLAVEPVLRMYILSLIATDFTRTKQELVGFFRETFWAHQYEDFERISGKLDKILELLEEYNFIKVHEEKLEATHLGVRVSQLYIDPLTAHKLICAINQAAKQEVGINELGVLQAICDTSEMRPLLRVKQSEYDELQEQVIKFEDFLYSQTKEEFYYDDFLEAFKTSLMFRSWLNESTEEKLLDDFGIRPGEFLVKMNNADWLLYSFEQLALLLGKKHLLTEIAKLRVRMKYGAKAELLSLLRFKNIGRVRARILYNANIRNARDVKASSFEKLVALLGRAITEDLKKQVEVRESM